MSLFKKINEGVNSLAIKAIAATPSSKPQSKTARKAKRILSIVTAFSVMSVISCITAFAAGGDMSFFTSAIDTLQVVVILIGGGVGVWGVINLLEGYGNDNPGAKSQGMKQLMAGVGVALVGVSLVPLIKDMFPA